MTQKEKAALIQKALIAAGKTNALSTKIILQVYLSDEEPLVNKLAEQMSVSAPAISRTLDNLEKRGLLKRRRNEKEDRRQVHVSLTSRGSIFIDKIMAE
jgi:DNA-binding MarR family transcriptional regulator